MADVQLENGYTRVANEILEEVVTRKFNATQLSVLMTVWRMTYGFNRKDHEIAISFLMKATGFSKRNIQEAINSLLQNKVLIETQPHSFNQTRKMAFNKNHDEWMIQSRSKDKQVNDSAPDDEKITSTGDESRTSTGEQSCTSTGDESCTQERKIKEISKEISKERDDQMDKPNPFREYESLFGHLPPAILQQQFNDWIDKSQFQEPETIICEVIRRAKLNTPRNPSKYIDKILMDLHNLELYTLAAVQDYNKTFDEKVKQRNAGNGITGKQLSSRPSGNQEIKPLTEEELKEIKEMEEHFPY